MDEEGLYAMVNCYVAPLALRSRYGSAVKIYRRRPGPSHAFWKPRPASWYADELVKPVK
jgi:hypothetical protein